MFIDAIVNWKSYFVPKKKEREVKKERIEKEN